MNRILLPLLAITLSLTPLLCWATEPKAEQVKAIAQLDERSGRVVRNSIGMTFVQIPAGQFMMGSQSHDLQAARDEQPRHAVRISKSFYLGMFEVTQQEYEKVMGKDPSSVSLVVPAKGQVDIIVTGSESLNPLSSLIKESIGREIATLTGVESVSPAHGGRMGVRREGRDKRATWRGGSR